MNFKLNLSGIKRLLNIKRPIEDASDRLPNLHVIPTNPEFYNPKPKYTFLRSIISNEGYDEAIRKTIEVDEYGITGNSKPIKVYGILKGSIHEWEELDQQLYLSKETARSACLAYVEEQNSKHYNKHKYAETTDGYWIQNAYFFVQLKEFTIS